MSDFEMPEINWDDILSHSTKTRTPEMERIFQEGVDRITKMRENMNVAFEITPEKIDQIRANAYIHADQSLKAALAEKPFNGDNALMHHSIDNLIEMRNQEINPYNVLNCANDPASRIAEIVVLWDEIIRLRQELEKR